MCGIAGYIRRTDSPLIDLKAMLRRLRHRGPDGQGLWHAQSGHWEIGLGHRRLSIIDLAGGRQPMSNEDGSVQVTFNGEIYNFRALRERLQASGHLFATNCDTEVIVHGFEQADEASIVDLHGMFAFAVWDSNRQTLTLARDRIGIKPLYYSPLPCGGLLFASELQALLAGSPRKYTVSQAALGSFLFRDYVQPPASILEGVFKLRPGHHLRWRSGATEEKEYWRPSVSLTHSQNTDASITELRELLEDAVASQRQADVPLGVFLSGGIDSSLVAALAARQAHDLRTFSIGFSDQDYDESRYARVVAKHIGATHTEEQLGESELVESIDAALDCLDEPMADPSIVPTYLLSRLAARHVKVALGGDGGDELWAGYPTYLAHRLGALYRLVPHVVRRFLVEPAVRGLPVGQGYQPLDWKLKRFVGRWDDDALLRHQMWMSNASKAQLGVLGFVLDDVRLPFKADCNSDTLSRVLAFDLRTYLPGSVLTKVDRASMACGLEVRPPLLAESLVDFAFTQPSNLKLRGRTSKWLLKEAAAPFLAAEIIHRKKKGFAMPLSRWISTALGPRISRLLSSSPIWDFRLLDPAVARAAWAEHTDRSADHARLLWAIVVLDHWAARYSEHLATG